MQPTYRDRWPIYASQWDHMTIDRVAFTHRAADRLVAAKKRYMAIAHDTGLPWAMIAVIHERESGQDWTTSLAQGDPWNKVSTHVPKGRGPFKSFEEAAIDALTHDGLNKINDWRLEKVFYHLESYNGWGYFSRGVPSPYVWAGSNQYQRGKFTADGKYSAATVDKQLGCATMLKAMMGLDSTIKFQRET